MKIGKTQTLKVKERSNYGLVLKDDEGNTILLPNKEVRKNYAPEEEVEVFLYLDSEDRPVATLRKPKIELGGFAPLKAVSVNKVGAFLDWGLDKDLFLPYSEQNAKIRPGRTYLVQLYEDKSGRLAATTKVYPKLRTDSPYKAGDWTEGYVYNINPRIGAFVAVDNQYNGMINKNDLNDSVHVGETVKVRVTEKTRDGKLTLSPIKKAYKEIVPDSVKIVNRLKENNGFLPFNDKSNPETIRAEFDISKGSFKKALGHLLKMKIIKQTDDGIELIDGKI